MSKDAYYFTHDSNAANDPKCVSLIDQLGMEGYGIFWTLIETLRDQPEYKYPIKLLPALARRYNTSFEKMKAVVYSYGLFVVEDNNVFFSESLIRRMKPLEEKRRKLSEAGKKGNITRWGTISQSRGDRKAIASRSQVKENRVDESTGNESKGAHTVSSNRKGVIGGKQSAADFLSWIESDHPTIHAMTEPFDEHQAHMIMAEYSTEDIIRIIEAMHNKGAHKNASAYGTFNSFAAHDSILKEKRRCAYKLYTYGEVCDMVAAGHAEADFDSKIIDGVRCFYRKIDAINTRMQPHVGPP